MMASLLYSTLLLFSSILLSHQIDSTILYSWRYPDWTYPSEEARQIAQQQGLFIPENGVILDSDYYFSPITSLKRVFITTPQFRAGIPATLSEVTRDRNLDQVLLKPFPNWDAQSHTTCDGPVSVYRILIDTCGLLWVIDTGRVETFVNPRRICRPKLLIYDLNNNDALVDRYEFPDGTINDRSNLITAVIESYSPDCRDSIAYIADVNANGLVVYDMTRRTSWRVESNLFYPYPHKGTVIMNGVTFDLMDGIFGLALSPSTDPDRKLYFHAFASVRESWVPLRIIKDQALVSNATVIRSQFYNSDDVRESQSTLEVMTEDGILIYTSVNNNALYCWNQATPFKKENQQLIYKDDENLQFVSGMKLKGDQLLITSSRLQNYINGDLNTNTVKYRIIIIDSVEQLLKNSICKKDSYRPNYYPSGSYNTGTSHASSQSGGYQSGSVGKPKPSSSAFPPKHTRPVSQSGSHYG